MKANYPQPGDALISHHNGQREWRTEYMAKTRGMSFHELEHTITDCRNAIEASRDNPPESPKAAFQISQYIEEIRYCDEELRARGLHAAKPHDEAVNGMRELHVAIYYDPNHRHIEAARDQLGRAQRAFIVADYDLCSDACHVGLTVMGQREGGRSC